MEVEKEAQRKRQIKSGVVVKDKLALLKMKTVTVEVERLAMHPRFKKYVRRFKRYLVHDDKNECRMGDRVEIVSTRPLSKLKSWRVSKILEKAS